MFKKTVLILSILTCVLQPAVSQVFSLKDVVPSTFFHQVYDEYYQNLQDRRDANSQYMSGLLTLFSVSESLLKQHDYYSHLQYDDANRQLTLTASVVSKSQTGYIKMYINDVPAKQWQQFEQVAYDYDKPEIKQKKLNQLVFDHVIDKADFELNVTQPLDTKKISQVLPVFKKAPDSLMLDEYPAHIYSRIFYSKDNGELTVDLDVEYKDRANLTFDLESTTYGDFVMNPHGQSNHDYERLVVNPQYMTIALENKTLIQDMIKLEIDSDSDFLSNMARQKVAMDIRAKSNKVESSIIKKYYHSLADFVQNPLQLRVSVISHARGDHDIDEFWYRLSQSVKYHSLLQSAEDSDQKKDISTHIAKKIRKMHYENHLKELLDVMNGTIEVQYYVNGQKV